MKLFADTPSDEDFKIVYRMNFQLISKRPISVVLSTFAQTPGVSIATFPRVQFAALQADEACGSETQFILYMTPGELLSRTFTPKDTHSPTGDLLVMYTDVGKVSEAHAKRALASALILGFHSPSFTFGTDLILPVEANKRLRAKLITRGLQQSDLGEERKGGISYSQIIESILKLIPTERKGDVSIYIPEVRKFYVKFSSTGKKQYPRGQCELMNCMCIIARVSSRLFQYTNFL